VQEQAPALHEDSSDAIPGVLKLASAAFCMLPHSCDALSWMNVLESLRAEITPMWKMSRAEMVIVAILALLAVAAGVLRIASRQHWGKGSISLVRDEAAVAKIDLNAAPWWEIAWLPGIGEAKAKAVVLHREQHGPFQQIDDLAEVPGFGAATVERLRQYIVLGDGAAPEDQLATPAPK